MFTKNSLKARKFTAYQVILLLTVLIPAVAIAQQVGTEVARYPGSHKIVVHKDDVAGLEAIGRLRPSHVIDYPDRKVFIVKDTELRALTSRVKEKVSAKDDLNKIFLRDRVIDTTKPIPAVPQALKALPTTGDQLFLLQFAGPIKDEWLKEVKNQGKVQFVTYIPNNAYIVYTDGPTLQKLRALFKTQPFIQWMGDFHPAYRIHPALQQAAAGVPEDIKVTIQFVAHEGVATSVSTVKGKAKRVLRDVWTVGPYKNLVIVVSSVELSSIAVLPDVVNIERWVEPRLFGERQGQILANQLNAAGSQPTGPGYIAWLNGLGFNTNFNFVVNVSDSGLDRGRTTAANLHQDFLDGAGNSRVAYVQQVSGTTIDNTAANNNDTIGHGTIDHAIVGGFNNTPDTPGGGTDFEDGAGYQYGLGIAPFVQLGSSRIFNPGWTFPDHTELTNAAYARGARISSNSWGSTIPTGAYDTTSQEYDALVRDARPATASDGGQAGNQEMVIVWAAGNAGPGATTIGDRGATAKNTMVVGAGENFNATGDADGCNAVTAPPCCDNNDADDVRDMIGFSSRGPTQDNRVKPDISAPGTHIFGAASQDANFNGQGVCGGPDNVTAGYTPNEDNYYPPDNVNDGTHPGGANEPAQTLYTWSSGTSHSCPAVAGAAALLRQWFLNQGRPAPSPAMTKAYLMNSTTWMTGVGVNDTLPSNNQGMGRLNLAQTFDAVQRMLTDQTTILDNTGDTFTVSGSIRANTQPFRVTLAWTDAPGATVGNAWVNDLDLEVTVNDGTGPVLYRGNNFNNNISQPGGASDLQNNVESIWLSAATTGNFTVTVRGSNIAGDGVPNIGDSTDQDFALVVYNASASIGQQISVVLDPDVRLKDGDTTTARATVTLAGVPQAGKTVKFRTGDITQATVSPQSALTDANGIATATVTGKSWKPHSTTLTAEVDSVSDTIPVRVPDLSLIGIVLLVLFLLLFILLRKQSTVSQR